MSNTSWRTYTAITLATGIPSLIFAAVAFIITIQSDEPLSIIGTALAVVLGLPVAMAVTLASVGIQLRTRRPDTAAKLAATGAIIIGIIATLVTMIWLPGLASQ